MIILLLGIGNNLSNKKRGQYSRNFNNWRKQFVFSLLRFFLEVGGRTTKEGHTLFSTVNCLRRPARFYFKADDQPKSAANNLHPTDRQEMGSITPLSLIPGEVGSTFF
jgi:hypothetical protein